VSTTSCENTQICWRQFIEHHTHQKINIKDSGGVLTTGFDGVADGAAQRAQYFPRTFRRTAKGRSARGGKIRAPWRLLPLLGVLEGGLLFFPVPWKLQRGARRGGWDNKHGVVLLALMAAGLLPTLLEEKGEDGGSEEGAEQQLGSPDGELTRRDSWAPWLLAGAGARSATEGGARPWGRRGKEEEGAGCPAWKRNREGAGQRRWEQRARRPPWLGCGAEDVTRRRIGRAGWSYCLPAGSARLLPIPVGRATAGEGARSHHGGEERGAVEGGAEASCHGWSRGGRALLCEGEEDMEERLWRLKKWRGGNEKWPSARGEGPYL
jgi:hypothetical protein